MFNIILALRYFLKRPISWLATFAVAISVFVVLVVMTVMNGLVVEYTAKNHRLVGDCIVHSESLVGFPYYQEFLIELRNQEFVEEASPVIKSFALMSQENYSWNEGVNLVGIVPQTHGKVTGFFDSLYRKTEAAQVFSAYYNPLSSGCVRGIAMMNRRNSQGEYDHDILQPMKLIFTCFPLSYKGTLLKAGRDVVSSKSFYVANDSDSGVAKIDGTTIYVSLENAQKLSGMDSTIARISAVYIKFVDGEGLKYAVDEVAKIWEEISNKHSNGKFVALLNNVKVEDWKTYRRESIAPMEKEQTMLTALFLLIGLVTVFVVFVVFFMIVNHKLKDIGIFRSFGISAFQINRLFLLSATIIGFVGTAVGVFCALIFLSKMNALEGVLFDKFGWQLWDRTIYNIGEIPDQLRSEVLCSVIVCSLAASVIGALLPVFRASRRKPVELLQVNE